MSALSKPSYLIGTSAKGMYSSSTSGSSFLQYSYHSTEFMTSGTTVNIVLSMVRFYTAMLESNPLITKSVTCSGVAALGNVISQLMQQKVRTQIT